MNMATSNRQIGSVTVVDVSGRIELGDESAAMRDLIRDLVSQGHKQILLNLGAVDYIDSAGLGSLIGALASVRRQGGEIKLLNLPDKVVGVMQVTRLYTVFDIVNGEAEGVNSFNQFKAASKS